MHCYKANTQDGSSCCARSQHSMLWLWEHTWHLLASAIAMDAPPIEPLPVHNIQPWYFQQHAISKETSKVFISSTPVPAWIDVRTTTSKAQNRCRRCVVLKQLIDSMCKQSSEEIAAPVWWQPSALPQLGSLASDTKLANLLAAPPTDTRRMNCISPAGARSQHEQSKGNCTMTHGLHWHVIAAFPGWRNASMPAFLPSNAGLVK